MTVSDSVQCSKLGCDVAASGVCAEGNDPAKSCPFYGGEIPTEEASSTSDIEEANEVTGWVQLPRGEALLPSDVDEFLRWRPANFITIVGERESGKTTLICAIYDRFLRGPFAGLLCAGSRTLVAFEKRSHLSRAESGLAWPDTAHTSISEGLRFFHLAVARADAVDERTDLMLSDRAGESYTEARGNSALVPDLIEVAKGSRVVLLLDGKRVADPVERAGAMQSVRQTVRAFLDGGVLDRSSVLQIVTTKVDLLEHHNEKHAIDVQLGEYRQRLEDDFASRVAELSFWDVAARDPNSVLPAAFGIEPLVTDWVKPRPAVIHRNEPAILLETEFDRLLQRTEIESFP